MAARIPTAVPATLLAAMPAVASGAVPAGVPAPAVVPTRRVAGTEALNEDSCCA